MPRVAGRWADVGAGEGTFTRALGERLGRGSRIYAVDRDARAIARLEHWGRGRGVDVIPVPADFTRPFALPGDDHAGLDGILLANALHFVRDAGAVLGRLVARLRPGGRAVIVEYDARAASRWVPYPIPAARLPEWAAAAGLSPPAVTATRPSSYGGIIYVAAAERITSC